MQEPSETDKEMIKAVGALIHEAFPKSNFMLLVHDEPEGPIQSVSNTDIENQKGMLEFVAKQIAGNHYSQDIFEGNQDG